MKTALTGILVLLAGAHVVHAQGNVSFANYNSATPTYLYVSFKPVGTAQLLGGSTIGPAPTLSNYAQEIHNGNDWSIELYGAAGANLPTQDLSPLGSIATFANGMNDQVAGTWSSIAIISIPGTSAANPIATIQLYAWYNDGGTLTNPYQAAAEGVPAGLSMEANVTVSFLPSAPAQLPYAALSGNDVFDGFDFYTTPTPTPEPGTISLGVMGAAALLMQLRRKN